MSVNVQYVGFKAKAMVREYSFLVRESSTEPHEITFTILNETFTSRRLSFQNAPDICSLKLQTGGPGHRPQDELGCPALGLLRAGLLSFP